MFDLLEITWQYLFPWPLTLIAIAIGVGCFAQSQGIGMPSKTPYEIFRRALVIDGTKYGGPVPLSNLILDESRVVNLANEKELQLHFRTMGIGARGYKSGWFKLRNGRNALVLITETSKVLCIPTTSDYVLLLSADDPESLISALREGNATKFEQKTA